MITATIKRWIHTLSDLVWPRRCVVCGATLASEQAHLCPLCLANIPITHLELHEFNPMEQLFAGRLPVLAHAAAYFWYEREAPYAKILHAAKYYHQPSVGLWLARRAASQFLATPFFQGVDVIVPVPIHPSKLAKRGYNQTHFIARGISEITGIPVSYDGVKALHARESQTHRGAFERQTATEARFTLSDSSLIGKHILIVDDVTTTGSTLLAVAAAFLPPASGFASREDFARAATATSTRISFFTLAITRLASR